jgi:hypothetical protein
MFKDFVKMATILTAIIIVLVTIITLSVFAMQPGEPIIFTNAILLILILVQLFMINVLIHIYELLDGTKVRRRKR